MFKREFLDVIGKDGVEKKWMIGFKDVRVGHYMEDDPNVVKDESWYRTICKNGEALLEEIGERDGAGWVFLARVGRVGTED